MTGRLVRVWKGYGTAEGVDRYYREHFLRTVLPQLRAIDGFIDATVLTRSTDDETQVVVVTIWESVAALKAFAGATYEKAVVEPIVHDLLERCDDEATHFTIVVGAGEQT